MASNKSSLYYLGVGCLIAGILIVGGFAAFGFLAYRWGKGLEETMKDPAARESRVLEILGGDELPEGYYGMVGFSVPMIMELAILTDREASEGEEIPDLGARGLIYMALRNFGRDREELRDFFDGTTDDPRVLDKHDVDLDLGKRITNGRIERPEGDISWVAHYGEVTSVQTRGRHEGLVTLFLVDCPGSSRNHIGIWFGPETETDESTESAESTELAKAEQEDAAPAPSYDGTVADPALVAEFVSYFRFCD